jgi:uncharacterized protein YbjT (DUF2867 family)
MYIVLGGTGHIGKTLIEELVKRNEEVTVVTHDAGKVQEIESKGAKAAVADVNDVEKLINIFEKGKRFFLLNPPADPATDIDVTERKTVQSILTAVKGSNAEYIVAASTYGAQKGDNIGDLGVLYELEQGLEQLGVPHTIIRSGYYYSNWDMAAESANTEGKLYTFFPPDFKLAMVAPADIAKLAAELLIKGTTNQKIVYCAGPTDYSANDVAKAFAKALNKDVEPVEIPKEAWEDTMQQVGYSGKSAKSMANMTRITIEQDYEIPDDPYRGAISIEEYIESSIKINKL